MYDTSLRCFLFRLTFFPSMVAVEGFCGPTGNRQPLCSGGVVHESRGIGASCVPNLPQLSPTAVSLLFFISENKVLVRVIISQPFPNFRSSVNKFILAGTHGPTNSHLASRFSEHHFRQRTNPNVYISQDPVRIELNNLRPNGLATQLRHDEPQSQPTDQPRSRLPLFSLRERHIRTIVFG